MAVGLFTYRDDEGVLLIEVQQERHKVGLHLLKKGTTRRTVTEASKTAKQPESGSTDRWEGLKEGREGEERRGGVALTHMLLALCTLHSHL